MKQPDPRALGEMLIGRVPQQSTLDLPMYDGKAFDVYRVIDGDTIQLAYPDRTGPVSRPRTRVFVNVTTVRFWGIDAPETAGFGKEAEQGSARAKAALTNLLEGHRVTLRLWKWSTRCRFGRLLAYVGLENGIEDVGLHLLQEGLVWWDPRFGHPLSCLYQAAEETARKNQLGLWQEYPRSGFPGYRYDL